MGNLEKINILLNKVKKTIVFLTVLLLILPGVAKAGDRAPVSGNNGILLVSLSPIGSGKNSNRNPKKKIKEDCPKCEGIIVGTRWCDNKNGTVTDLTTGLVWLKSASWGWVFPFWADSIKGTNAFDRAAQVKSGNPKALTDNSVAGDWRLPTINELKGLTSGPEAVSSSAMRAFTNVQPDWYWSGTSYATGADSAWNVGMHYGDVNNSNKAYNYHVWPVRGGND